jgi:hypothetical protein
MDYTYVQLLTSKCSPGTRIVRAETGAMADPDELKKVIAATWHDEETASSARYGVESY